TPVISRSSGAITVEMIIVPANVMPSAVESRVSTGDSNRNVSKIVRVKGGNAWVKLHVSSALAVTITSTPSARAVNSAGTVIPATGPLGRGRGRVPPPVVSVRSVTGSTVNRPPGQKSVNSEPTPVSEPTGTFTPVPVCTTTDLTSSGVISSPRVCRWNRWYRPL